MTASEPLTTISVHGNGCLPAFAAAYLATRFPAPQTQVTWVRDRDETLADDVLIRPDCHRVHSQIGLTPDHLRTIGAVPVLGDRTDGTRACILPLGDYGRMRDGVSFLSYWLRASALGDVRPLDDYNLALRVMKASGAQFKPADRLPAVSVGLRVPASGFAQALAACAEASGARIISSKSSSVVTGEGQESPTVIRTENGDIESDLCLDYTENTASADDAITAPWQGSLISLGRFFHGVPDISGSCYRVGMDVINDGVSLMPDKHCAAVEVAEFNRLVAVRRERIVDMHALLFGEGTASSRPAVQRKTGMFESQWRVPAEEYEFFSPPEWIAALLAHCDKPSGYNRLADRLDEGELMSWLSTMVADIDAAIQIPPSGEEGGHV